MSAAVAKIGSRYFINAEILQNIGTELEKLPKKEKTMFEFKDAAAFLCPFFKSAIQKNYTKEDILQVIVKTGWSITHSSFKYLWSLFLLENEIPSKKKPSSRPVAKQKSEIHSHVVKQDQTPENAIKVAIPQKNINENSTLNNEETDKTENSASDDKNVNQNINSANSDMSSEKSGEKSQQHSSARFDLPPDSDDL